MSSQIFLIGFMGTGKTTVGTALAERLGYELIDTDHQIVARTGQRIPELFQERGEAYFRQMESEVLADLVKKERAVITTGGGAVLAADNRAVIARAGLVVCLTASVEEIVRRVAADENRPLLKSEGDLQSRIEELIQSRAGLYDFAHLTINTTGMAVDSIVGGIVHHLATLPR